jgi:hypothetical protein
MRKWVYSYTFLTSASGGKWLLHALVALPPTPSKDHWYPLMRRQSGPQSQCEHFDKGRTVMHLPGFEP